MKDRIMKCTEIRELFPDLAAGLVAAESRTAARGLDWVEVKLRGAIRRFRGSPN